MVGDILQPTHLLFVLVIALLVLGPKRLPEVGRTLGNGIRDFRSAINGETTESREELPSKPWHSDAEPEEKHEFAHAASETTPDSHEFAHDAPGAPAGTSTSEAPAGAGAPAPEAPPAQAAPPAEAAAPASASNTAVTPDKHTFAYESSEAGENPAGPPS
jgi:sec-independent protein translocase protein TatA